MNDPESQREAELADFLAEARTSIRSGGIPDLSTWQSRYPDQIGELIGLLKTVQDLDTLLNDRPVSATVDYVIGHSQAGVGATPGPLPAEIGRYRILEWLGSGGMGTVYRAHDPHLNREVALKVPRLEAIREDPGLAVQRFLREVRAAAGVRHPHVCPIHDAGEHAGIPYVVMAFIQGPNLMALLQPDGLEPRRASKLVSKVALGLEAIHAQGIIHRDLKPGNILLDAADEPLVTDFGLACLGQEQKPLTAYGVVLGTPGYMAPEQVSPQVGPLGPWTDIYSLGVVLYQLLCGRTPFVGSGLTLLFQIAHDRPPPPSQFRADLDPALEAIVLKALAQRPEDRFASAGQFSEALEGWLRGEPPIVNRDLPAVADSAKTSPMTLRTDLPGGGAVTVTLEGGSKMPSELELTVEQQQASARKRRRKLRIKITVAVLLLLLVAGFLALLPWIGSQREEYAMLIGENEKVWPGFRSERPKPKVITIENGLTVDKDGTGQYTTIGEALAKVKPGQTIRVLDKAIYTEAIRIDNRGQMEGITLESPQGATIMTPTKGRIGLLIFHVPRVTVRGFRFDRAGFDAAKGSAFFIIVGGKSAGATLEALDVRSTSGSSVGLSIEHLSLSGDDAPITVRNCQFTGLYRGIRVSGTSDAGKAAPSRRAVLHDNAVSDCTVGIWAGGLISDVHIVGNRAWNCQATLQIEDLFQDCSNVLIANNSFLNETSCIQIQDLSQPVKGIAIRNNLFMAGRGPDLEFLGANQKFVANLRFDHNWREVRAPPDKTAEARSWIPFSPQDVHTKNQIAVISRDPKDIDFLRPKKSSPLATRGAGGDLPSYVGALPPEGVQRWDWEKTWKAQGRKSEQPASKSGKD